MRKKKKVKVTIDEKVAEKPSPAKKEISIEQLQSNQDYIRQVCTIALQQIQDSEQEQSIIYGTQEGSLGQIVQIPKFAYMFLKRLTEVMETIVRGMSRITLKEYRQVKLDGGQPEEPQNIIDGDYIEQFLDIDEPVQAKIVQMMLLNSNDTSHAYLLEVKQLIHLLQQKHWLIGI